MDRRDGTDRRGRGGKQAGKFSTGEGDARVYQKKGQNATNEGEGHDDTEAKEKKEEPPAEEEKEVIYGVSYEDYFKSNALLGAKEARTATGVSKDVKVKANDKLKEHEQTTKIKNTTMLMTKGPKM